MKKIKKYTSDSTGLGFSSKLLSYSALAAGALACPTDMAAQCGTATVGAPLDVDFDGDGVADATLLALSYPGPYLLSSTMIVTGTADIVNPLSFPQTVTVTQPGPGTSWNGCITTNYGGFTAIVPYATATGQIQITGSSVLQDITIYQNIYYLYGLNLGYVVGANIVGLSSAGSSVCPAGVSPASNTVLAGGEVCYSFASAYNIVANSVYYNLIPSSGVVTYDAPPCTTTGGNYYAGLMQSVGLLPLMTTVAGPFLLASGSSSGSLGCAPIAGTSFVGVQFTAGATGETHFGWIEVMFDAATGAVTCVDNGFQLCSLEAATIAGDPTYACIQTGEATNAETACIPCGAEAGDFPALAPRVGNNLEKKEEAPEEKEGVGMKN